jgi:hypothetical protein
MAASVARFGFVLVVAVAVLGFTSESPAAFGVANLSFTGVTGMSGTVNYYDKESSSIKTTGGIGIGKLTWTVNSPPSPDPLVPVGPNFPTFCIELERVLSSPGTFNVGLVQSAPNPSTSSPFPSGSIGAVREGYLGRLYDIAYLGLNTTTDFAAFQLAVWELSHETDTLNPFNVSAGTFKLASGANALAVSTANGWLTSAASNSVIPHVLNIYALSSATNQDQIFAVPAPPSSGLPEASAITTWGLILLSLGLISPRLRVAA